MTEAPALRLASALATRLCHDMAGLLGNMAGMLDLLDEEAEARSLATETATTLIARVRLLRTAWGGGGGTLDAPALLALADGLPGVERLRLDFSGLHGELPETPARLLLCLLLAALPGLPRGGAIIVASAGDGVSITLSGNGATWPELLAACASSERACWDAGASPKALAPALACLLASEGGWAVQPRGLAVHLTPA